LWGQGPGRSDSGQRYAAHATILKPAFAPVARGARVPRRKLPAVNLQPGRNDPCHCGSGKRYKACCGQLTPATQSDSRTQQERLGELVALLSAGRFAELEVQARAMLDTWPRAGAGWQLLAVALGRLDKDPLQALATAAQLMPEDAPAQLNLGNALGRVGRVEEAETCFRRALLLQPQFPQAHNNLGELQLELGQLRQAAAGFRRATQIDTGYADAHRNLGKTLLRLGQYAEALESSHRSVSLGPDSAQAHNGLGNALVRLARPREAIDSFRRALALDPGFAESHANLGNALRSLGNLDEAGECYRRALELDPGFVMAHIELATVLRLQRRTTDAEMCCQQALRIAPDSSAALAVLAELRADSGQFSAAQNLFERAVAIDPELVDAWAGLARVRRMSTEPADRAWLSAVQALADRDLAPPREMTLRFAIGKYFDDVRDFPNAFRNYQRANELAKRCGPPHDRRELSRRVDLIIRSNPIPTSQQRAERQPVGPHGRAADGGSRADRPVFIVGMLRSGTTLAEQILASHPGVFGAGELTYWTTELATMAPGGSRGSKYLDKYLDMLDQLSPPTAIRVIDKLPTNFLALGLIHAALPAARIIHMRRNPADTCLSIYFQHFEAANTYANDLDDLAHYYREYQRLMDHWRRLLPAGRMLEVSYEDLVENPQRETRRMLDFMGLPWDPACLEFHRAARSVVTASKWQVRQAVNTTSVARWRNYEAFIGPLTSL
jgi:tetratricopeptide (TPR) repeat protein